MCIGNVIDTFPIVYSEALELKTNRLYYILTFEKLIWNIDFNILKVNMTSRNILEIYVRLPDHSRLHISVCRLLCSATWLTLWVCWLPFEWQFSSESLLSRIYTDCTFTVREWLTFCPSKTSKPIQNRVLRTKRTLSRIKKICLDYRADSTKREFQETEKMLL